MTAKELAGRVAAVTGAGRNIGKAIALELAAGGAAVIVNARSNQREADAVVREIEAAGGKAVAVLGDVSDPATAKNLAAAAQKLGRLDFLINNAAIRKETPLEKMSFEEWRQVHGIILDGAFHCVQACAPLLRKRRRCHRQYRRHERAWRLQAPHPCADGEVRAGRLQQGPGARSRRRSCDGELSFARPDPDHAPDRRARAAASRRLQGR